MWQSENPVLGPMSSGESASTPLHCVVSRDCQSVGCWDRLTQGMVQCLRSMKPMSTHKQRAEPQHRVHNYFSL